MATRRSTIALALALAACYAAVAAPAPAKAPTHAVLEDPTQLAQAAAGERIALMWTLDTPARLRTPPGADSAVPHDFGVYVRAHGAAGTAPLTVAGRPAATHARGYPRGRYVAALTVPPGGVSAIEIGVRGTYGTGPSAIRTEDPIAIGNDPIADVPAGAHVGGDSGPGVPWGVFAAALGGLGLLLGAGRGLSARRAVT